MNLRLSLIIRVSSLAILSLAGVSCVDNPNGAYRPDGNVFITDRPPRYGYRGTHSPNYETREPQPANAGIASAPENKPAAGESAADLHKKETAATDTKPGVTNPPVVEKKDSEKKITAPEPAKRSETNLPYGTPVIGKKGYVYSPFAPEKGMVDVNDIPSGTKVECPYTGKIFRVP